MSIAPSSTPSAHYRGRFAPTPSGPLHFGSLITALASWLDARQSQGEWWLRIDDIDPPREVPGAASTICRQLEGFGLYWDKRLYQSERSDAYVQTLERLLDAGLAFHCALSRQQLASMGNRHPGISLALPATADTAIRLAVEDRQLNYPDLLLPAYSVNLQTLGGAFVIRRRDGLFAYHLACAVDDATLGMTHVLRGSDLLNATPQQCWFMQCMGWQPPSYGHLPLVVEAGVKLSKSSASAALNPQLREQQLCQAFSALGQQPPADLATSSVADILDWGVANWSRERLPTGSIDIHQV